MIIIIIIIIKKDNNNNNNNNKISWTSQQMYIIFNNLRFSKNNIINENYAIID